MKRRRPANEPPSPGFAPVRMQLIDLESPLPAMPVEIARSGVAYRSALCLVRLHGRPLGLVDVEIPPDGLSPEQLAAHIQRELGDAIAAHLREDRLPHQVLTAQGFANGNSPACTTARERLLANPPEASVVIITRDRPDRVRDTINSILECRYPKDRYELIVVHTPSEPGSTFNLEDLNGDARIRVVEEPRPGVSLARNTGLEHASGEFVVFADDDVDVDRDWLATSLCAFLEDDRVGATSGMTLPGRLATPSQRWFEGFGGLQRGFETRAYNMLEPPADQPLFPFTVGEFGSGRSMAFRRDLFRRLGGFDLALGPSTPTLAGEDIEALMRVLLSGATLVHEPAAIVWHAHPSNYEMLRRRMWGYGVGLTACLTKAVTQHPELLPLLARKLPAGLRFALAPSSDKNKKRQADYPSELIRLELLGMAYGPVAYSLSRWQRRRRRSAWPVDADAA